MVIPPFSNEPLTDFFTNENRQGFLAALSRVKNALGQTYPLIIGGREIATTDVIRSVNPAHPEQVVGCHAVAVQEHVDQAVSAATAAFRSWSRTSVEDRAAVLLRAARTRGGGVDCR